MKVQGGWLQKVRVHVGYFIKLDLKVAENKGWRIREAIILLRGRIWETKSIMEQCMVYSSTDYGWDICVYLYTKRRHKI